MKERDFCYWLKGLFELNKDLKTLDETQTQEIKNHLDLVFTKVTPEVIDGETLSDSEKNKIFTLPNQCHRLSDTKYC